MQHTDSMRPLRFDIVRPYPALILLVIACAVHVGILWPWLNPGAQARLS